jgi:negative regulator of sigma-B (phosphoserine phosphatase)
VRITTEHITRPCDGHDRSGDVVVVRVTEAAALIAVIDALGHGPKAADIAELAARQLLATPLDEEMMRTMARLHEALHGTRGAAAMVAVLRGGAIEGCGVGNVELRSLGGSVPVVQSPGILGVRVRRYNVFSARLEPGTRLVLFSDGISAHVQVAQTEQMEPREACESIFRGYRRAHDDASVLVVDVEE